MNAVQTAACARARAILDQLDAELGAAIDTAADSLVEIGFYDTAAELDGLSVRGELDLAFDAVERDAEAL